MITLSCRFRRALTPLSSQWEATQDNLKLNMLRNVYGLHAPVRLLMERQIVGYVGSSYSFEWACLTEPQNPHMPALRVPNIHMDILMGRDETLDTTDFMTPGAFCLDCCQCIL